MKIRSFPAAALAAALLAGIPATAAWSADKAEVDKAIAAAEAARKQAASVGGEWRDTGKFIKQAQKLAEEGKLDEALKLAIKAKNQGELGYQQALDQKDVSMADYIKAGGETQHTAAVAAENNIAENLSAVEVMHSGEKIVVQRHHDRDATLPEEFAKTDRGCPPFCVQPMIVAEGVETIGELEVLDYLQKSAKGDASILVVDSRTPDWAMRGTIPGSVNIPWTSINLEKDGSFFQEAESADTLTEVLTTHFGAKKAKKGWDFSGAKTLVMFCNGIWCPQSSLNIKTLIELGYPADKIKWYRGGVQDWVSVGLTTVKP